MNRKLFESFYNGNIEKIAKEICKEHSEFHYSANLNGVFEEYLNQVALLRRLLKPTNNDEAVSASDVNGGKGQQLLDGHKVAACITCAITKVRLITSDKIDDPDNDRYKLSKANRMNEQVAVLSGLSCLVEYMVDNPENLVPNNSDEKKIELKWPTTFYENQPHYLDSLVRALYYSNTFSIINPLLLAHIFFLLESYHRKSVEMINSTANAEVTDCETKARNKEDYRKNLLK